MSISNIILSSKSLSKLACLALRIKSQGYNNQMNKRKDLDLFDYKHIAQPLQKHYDEICADNNCFGIGYSLRKYAGWKKRYMNQFVEHGYFFGSYISQQEIHSFSNTILTFGNVRKKHIESQINKKAIPIGPYICYAEPYYDPKKFEATKKELGRTLLVFFSHASTGCVVDFDLDFMIGKIESIRSGFDTIVISVFWSDITEAMEKKLSDKGYIIFSSGHRYDYLFLSRQRTMIELADVTMSNSVSTHVGYCVGLGKPHWLIRQEVIEKAVTEKGTANVQIASVIESDKIRNAEVEELYECFSEYSDTITSKQIEISSKYFGYEHVKTRDELFNILKECK